MSAQGGAGEGAAEKPSGFGICEAKRAGYTRTEAKQIMDANTADDNACVMRLAERLYSKGCGHFKPLAIRASIPEQARCLLFGVRCR